ncbi:hypothetical protein [Borrelia turcica]|nr:hypothetical protein [Borrelia turcica]
MPYTKNLVEAIDIETIFIITNVIKSLFYQGSIDSIKKDAENFGK